MKQIILLFAMMLLPMVASADAVEIDGIYYELNSTIKEATVTKKPNGYYLGSKVIPASVTYNGMTYSVTSIGYQAFYNCSGLTSVTIPNSVTSIGQLAFDRCSGLTSPVYNSALFARLPSSFRGSYNIPDGIKEICGGAFYDCSGLKSVTIPNSVTNIGAYAFDSCRSLTSVTIPNSVTSIEGSTFAYCSGLTSVTIPNSVMSIGPAVFRECSGLTSVTIPNSVSSIGDYAFEGCNSLTSVLIPNSVTSIGKCAFSGCSGMTTVTIGSGVKNIGSQAFASCKELTDVYCLADNVPSTNTDAFKESLIEYATLHVPTASIDAYKAVEPWKNFKKIKSLTGEDIPEEPEVKKCATPTIAFVYGELVFSCETDGVEYVSEVTSKEVKKYYENKVKIGGTYTVTVYATKAGWENSDVATLEFTLGNNGKVCDVNKDGSVDVADIATIISEMAARAREQKKIDE